MFRLKGLMTVSEYAKNKKNDNEPPKPKKYPEELKSFFGSFFERFHGVQLLNAEWGPWIVAMFLYVHFQSTIKGVEIGYYTELLIIALTTSRYMFALRPFLGKLAALWSPIWMTVCYTSFFFLIPVAFTY
jgi:hypothetical protein